MPGAGIAKPDRIRSRVEYSKIQKQGKRFRAGNFLVNYLKREDGRMRFGVVVSGRMARAVDRNRAKRLLREFFRLNREQIRQVFVNILDPGNPGIDMVFVAYPGAEQMKYGEVREQLLLGFEKEIKRTAGNR